MTRLSALFASLLLLSLGISTAGVQAFGSGPDNGTVGIGDPYFPRDGNGGYDVRNYDLTLDYRPATDRLIGTARITARATQRLTRFDLDLVGMKVGEVRVDGRPATWSRHGQELRVQPARPITKGARFRVRIGYSGVPRSLEFAGFLTTETGATVEGQPHGAAAWFPANDHPTDAATFTFRVTVPKRLSVMANGRLVGKERHGARTTWTWRAGAPMATYLATIAIGDWVRNSYKRDGIRYADAVQRSLLAPVGTPTDGTRFALSGAANSSYKRLTHEISVPADGATVSFTMSRQLEPDWDYVFVEAHTVGEDDWTTLEDLNGHSSQDTGGSCTEWPDERPFIPAHYQTYDPAEGACSPQGATGSWWAATGNARDERWTVDLGDFAGRTVELSITTVTDAIYSFNGVFVDDVEVSTGEGTTSFESGLDGWTVPGPPPGDEPNGNDWFVGTADDAPPTLGEVALGSLAREPEIIDFLAGVFGPYPFGSAGGIVDGLYTGIALETQTRPVYDVWFFPDAETGDNVLVHELTHQWYGDSVRLHRWRDLWLNEGVATYTEWLWSEREGFGTVQEIADSYYAIEPDDPFWQLQIGDPGPDGLFDSAVYVRGGLTMQALRLEVGDEAFFEILKAWPAERARRTGTTGQFIRLAERISGRQLDDLFDSWLFMVGRPPSDTLGARPATGPRTDRVRLLRHHG